MRPVFVYAQHAGPLKDLDDAGSALADAVRRGREEGMVAGMEAGMIAQARSMLRMFVASAGVALRADDEARIDACQELALLNAWVLRAAIARTSGDVFGG